MGHSVHSLKTQWQLGFLRGSIRIPGMSSAQSRFRDLLKSPQLAELGPGPRTGVRSVSEVDSMVGEVPAQSRELVRALILLWHDHLDEAHRISQEIENRDGSFVHAIMHRREPDFWNSKYWWRRVGNHPAFAEIASRVESLLKEREAEELSRKLLPNGKWDPCAFVEACETARPENELLLREIQRIEAECALEYFLGRDAR
jgi:hypothetical protein